MAGFGQGPSKTREPFAECILWLTKRSTEAHETGVKYELRAGKAIVEGAE